MSEMPNLAALVKRHKDDSFALLGINTGDPAETFRKKLVEHEVTWDHIWQGEETAIAKLFRVRGYPTIYVLDREGRIRFKDVRGAALDQAVTKLLAESE